MTQLIQLLSQPVTVNIGMIIGFAIGISFISFVFGMIYQSQGWGDGVKMYAFIEKPKTLEEKIACIAVIAILVIAIIANCFILLWLTKWFCK